MAEKRFSETLEELLSGHKQLKLADLVNKFEEKGFAILCFLLMALPALPLPTGGVTHVFEVIVLLLGLEMIAGRKRVWLPKKWLHLKLPSKLQSAGLPKLLNIVR